MSGLDDVGFSHVPHGGNFGGDGYASELTGGAAGTASAPEYLWRVALGLGQSVRAPRLRMPRLHPR